MTDRPTRLIWPRWTRVGEEDHYRLRIDGTVYATLIYDDGWWASVMRADEPLRIPAPSSADLDAAKFAMAFVTGIVIDKLGLDTGDIHVIEP
jgi:hypothetical protein